jgi:phosphomannomutase
MTTPIKFGTDGWRAIIADTFTFENVRIAAQATADYFKTVEGPERAVFVGFDVRFQSQAFARCGGSDRGKWLRCGDAGSAVPDALHVI